MKNLWKWILGAVILLVVAAGLFGLGFVWRTRMAATAPVAIQRSAPNPPQWRGPMRGGVPGGRMMAPGMGPMRGFGYGRRPFMPGMMILGFFGRLMIPLGLLLLLLFVAYQLGKGRNAPTPVVVTSSPVSTVSEPVVTAPVTTHPCPACNATVQDDWKHCPNCGEKQAT